MASRCGESLATWAPAAATAACSQHDTPRLLPLLLRVQDNAQALGGAAYAPAKFLLKPAQCSEFLLKCGAQSVPPKEHDSGQAPERAVRNILHRHAQTYVAILPKVTAIL